jgi:multidrug efflux pump subunit AcrB
MIAAFTDFFLKNEKITFILILIISLFGFLSYSILPKQYNPSIVAPAFMIEIPAYGYSANEGHEYVIKSIENKVRELVGVDKIYGYATDGYVSVMVTFQVGVKQEDAKTRLYDKMYANYDLRPYNIKDVIIRSIDPEDLPQVTYAITYSGSDILDIKEQGQYLQNIAKTLREHIKTVPGTTAIDIVWWYSNDISIELSPKQIEVFGLDILFVVGKLKEVFGKYMIGEATTEDGRFAIYIDQDTDTMNRLKNFPILINWSKKVLLQDIASIHTGPIDITKRYEYVSSGKISQTVFLWVAKLKWTNAVHIVESVHEVVNEVRKTLPNNINIVTIQDEWETAREATSELMLHLFVSIAIVLVILIIFLWVRDAINAAFCIPMVLGIVFIVALVLGLDINRITLFALILSLGILVDDSIVMVENNSRHLAMMHRTWKTKHEAIIDSVREVGMSIVVSTITRVISFLAMFAVTWMMGDYMKPIPIFASIALTASLVVAFSINPFLASYLYKPGKAWHHDTKEGRFLHWYGKKLEIFINRDNRTSRMRRWLKIGFWISLGIILVAPIMLDVFKARMLPKADKNQVYLWIDAPNHASIDTTADIAREAEIFLLGYKKSQSWTTISGEARISRILPKHLRIVESTSTAIGDRLPADFANLFRWWNNRLQENQMSMRINLVPSHDRELKSEDWVIAVRPLLISALKNKYKDIKIRLLEDPPGPPTQATFHLKVQWSPDSSYTSLVRFADAIEKVVRSIAQEEAIVDLTNSYSTTAPSIHITLDHDRIMEAGLSETQITNTLAVFYGDTKLSIARHDAEKYGASEIHVGVNREDKNNIAQIRSLYFTNTAWKKIGLSDIAKIETDFKSHDIYTDERIETIHLYSEMWSNSVVYPIIRLYSLFGDDEFEKSWYKRVSSTPYSMSFIWISDWKKYSIQWGGEWELTMDTFRDLGLAMIFSLFVIYFIIVTQFGSFQIGGIVMTTFLLSFFGIFPGFSLLYLISGTYFTATAMIGAIALGGIVVWNALILIDYINQLLAEGKSLEYAVIEGSKKRFVPVMLTSVAAIAGSFIITSDPVWSGLAWSIITGLSASAVLTLYFVPIFYYSYLRKYHTSDVSGIQLAHILEHEKSLHSNDHQ